MTSSPSPRQVAVVTGAGRGIGLEVARQLISHGFAVIMLSRTDSAPREAGALRATGAEAEGFAVDLTDETAVRRVIATLEDGYPAVDVLVNNAGRHDGRSSTGVDPASLRSLLEINLVAAWSLTSKLLPLLRRSTHPRIVNVSSGAASMCSREEGLGASDGTEAAYAVSKAALAAYTRGLAAEMSATPVVVNAVCPGFTASRPEYAAAGARPLEEGALSVVMAALVPPDGPRGAFLRDGKVLPW